MAEELPNELPTTNQRSRRAGSTGPNSLRAIAIRASIVFHIALIILLAFWYLPALQSEPAVGAAKPDTAKEPLVSKPNIPIPTDTRPAANVPDDQIRSSVTSQIQSVARQSQGRMQQQFDQDLERLQRLVKPESVDELVETVGRSVGVDTKMYADKAPVAGTTFNPNTAQLTSVERKSAADGSWTYEALMVDANGNRSTVPMPAAEGAAAYDAFEKIKSMPMAGALYQQLVMPMLQQMVAPENPRPAGNTVIVPAPESKLEEDLK